MLYMYRTLVGSLFQLPNRMQRDQRLNIFYSETICTLVCVLDMVAMIFLEALVEGHVLEHLKQTI